MKTLFAAAVAVSVLTGVVATAQADDGWERGRHHDRGNYRGRDRWDDRHDRDRYRRDDYRRNDHWRDHDRRYYRHDRHHWDRRDAYRDGYIRGRGDHRRFDRGRYIPPRGFYRHAWRHGDYLPRAYCSNGYVVHDYHAYHLSPPPHGHHWVRVNEDVVLAAVASGLVVSVVNGLFY